MKTTLNKIRVCRPCKNGWTKLLAHLGKTKADDEPLSISTILKSNGLDDALWCLRSVEGRDKEIRLLAVSFARQVQHLMTDPRSRQALDVAERFANGLTTRGELAAARAAAWDAASGAAWDAGVAAWGAAWDAVGAAAWGAARAAARAVAAAARARAVAGDAGTAARAAAWDAASGAAWDAGVAAWDAVGAAAWGAARAAARAVAAAARARAVAGDAGTAAWDAAWDAYRVGQKALLIEACEEGEKTDD